MTAKTKGDPVGERPEANKTETDAVSASDRGFGWVRRLTHPAWLFPILGVVALAVLWTTTLHLIRVERENARLSALSTSQELLETYEAQVVRTMREIDQALKGIQYTFRLHGDKETLLDELNDMRLLPPDLLFPVSLANPEGEVVAANGEPSRAILDPALVERVRASDGMVELPARRFEDDWRLAFARRLTRADGSFGGVAVVEVDAAFFVSGYERSKLGDRGVLAVLGSDGIFRVRRTGSKVSFGSRTNYDAVVTERGLGDAAAVLAVNRWDAVPRYTSARQLYDFPLAVVVGLSEDERAAAAEAWTDVYLQRAAFGSVLLIAVLMILGRMSWRLETLRRREAESRVAHARRVEHLAYHDALTGLPNRSLLHKLVEDRIHHSVRNRSQFALLFLDLDRFKQINDTLGHDAGDELLQEVGERLEGALRDSDTVARMGGDEFVILLPEIERPEQVEVVAQKVLSVLRDPVVLLGEKFSVTVSIGISQFPHDGSDQATLMKNADIAMYAAKEAGRNSFRFFSTEMSASSIERLNLESSLRQALENQEFVLHYQARRDLDSETITGVEALLRWEHPELGTLAPPQFLSLAEENGLILPIGRWVLRTACRQSVAWREQGMADFYMAVNLSATQFFDENLSADVVAALEETGMPPGLLEFEICESVLARDAESSLPILRSLKQLGVRITVDNFGTGYSPLAVLRQLPVDTIKVGKLFLRDSGDAVAQEVSNAIIAMGRTISSSVVAHGVETQAQADFLREQSGSQVQGFYFNRPVSAEDFALMMQNEAVPLRRAG